MSSDLSIQPVIGTEGCIDYTADDVATLEHAAALRAGTLLRQKLSPKEMMTLLQDEIDEADARYTAYVEEAGDRWQQIDGFELEVKGFTFEGWFKFLEENLDDEAMHFSVHPEHFIWTTAEKLDEDPARGHHVIVEPMGEMMLRFYVKDGDWEGMEDYFDDDFDHHRGTELALRNGTVVGKSVSQGKDTEDGFLFRFLALKPASVPSDVLGSMDHGFLEYVRYIERAHERSN
jgi:hypothetical protein